MDRTKILHDIESSYRASAVRFLEGEGRIKGGKKRKERERAVENGRRLKYFRGSRGRAIIEKGFHFASVLLTGKNCESFEFPSEIYPAPHRSFILPAFRPLRRSLSSRKRERSVGRLTEAKNYEFTRRSRRRLRGAK